MTTPPSTPEWRRLLAAARHAADALPRPSIPDGPGVYAWRHDDEVVYVGTAARLRQRLSTHRGRGTCLRGSAFRRNVAHLLLGVEPARLAGPDRERLPEADAAAVSAWIRACELSWVECADADAARMLERELLEQWRPPINRR